MITPSFIGDPCTAKTSILEAIATRGEKLGYKVIRYFDAADVLFHAPADSDTAAASSKAPRWVRPVIWP